MSARLPTYGNRLAPNPTSRRDHSDLLRFHFFDQNEKDRAIWGASGLGPIAAGLRSASSDRLP
jgi:hypothetical protein